MRKLLEVSVLLSGMIISSSALSYNLFSLKLEGGGAMTPDGSVLSNSTLLTTDTDKFSARWVSDNKSTSNSKKSLLSKNKTDNTAYFGIGVITKSHPAIPVRGELLLSYYPKYKIGYHGTGVAGFPTTAKLTTELARYTAFVNGYVDVLKIKTKTTIFDFFIQGGVGTSFNDLRNVVITGATDNYTLTKEDKKNSRDNSLAWNLGLGTNVSFYDDYSVGLGYRYIKFNEARSSNVALNSGGTWDVTRNPFNIETNSHLFYLSVAFA